MVKIKNTSNQKIELYIKNSTETIVLLPRDTAVVAEMTPQIENLKAQHMIKILAK